MRKNWDDLRFILAVAEAGSVSGAARALGVNHATVLRRIAAYEAAAGMTLFDRSARGYAVPAERQAVVAAAREVDTAVQSLMRILRGTQAPVSGEVRLTTTDSLGVLVLPAVLAELRAAAPDLTIKVLSSNARYDLGRDAADVSVRAALQLPDDLTGSRVGPLGFAAYRRKGTEPDGWLGMAGVIAGAPVARWMREELRPAVLSGASDSFLVLREMAAEGLGAALLPCYAGEADPRLERMPDIPVPHLADLWVATHHDLAAIPRVARVRALLAAALARQAGRIADGR